MSADTYAVALSRVLKDDVPVGPCEAIAILDAIWAVTAATVDDRGFYLAIPLPGECVLTAFGDIEVERSARDAQALCGPVEVATALCRVFVRLTHSAQIGDSSVRSTMAEALQPVRAQAAAEGRVAFETPEALLAAWTWLRAPDGSAALANLYARWEIASASVPAWTEPDLTARVVLPRTMQPLSPLVTVASTASPRRPPGGSARARVAAAAAAALMLIVLGAGAARVRRTSPSAAAHSTYGSDYSASSHTTAVHTDLEPSHGSVSPSVTDASAAPAPADLGTTSELARTAAPQRDAPASMSTVPRRMVRAADVGATPYSPSFAPSTGSLLFHSGLARTGLHEATLRADGTIAQVRTLVRDGANSYHVQISPDGTQMAFDSDRQGERAVYVASRDGSGMRRVSGEGMALVPSWAPDGTRLAFVRAEPRRPRVWQLWTVDLRTNRLQQHTFHQVGQPWGGSWFPDGRHIAYSLEDRLVLLDMYSGARRVYASPLPGRLVRTPAVSPDGDRIAFQVRQSGMWMLHIASGRTVRVLTDRSAQEFAWSPDGRSVAYHSVRGGAWEIWTVPVSGL